MSIRIGARLAWTATRAFVPLLALISSSCGGQKDPPQSEPIEILVTGENAHPLPNAQIVHEGQVLAVTGTDGISRLQVGGKEGTSYGVELQCPPGYHEITPSLVVTKVNLGPTAHPAQYSLSCKKLTHVLVVAIRASEVGDKKKLVPLAGLPIVYLGEEKAYTDASGAVTMWADLQDGQHFDFTVGTPGKSNATLHPQNPINSYIGRGRDEVVLLDLQFTRDKAPKPRGGGVVRHGPRPL